MVERSSAMSRLYRSTRDKVMTGLAGGLSETLGIDSTLFGFCYWSAFRLQEVP